MTSNPFGQQEYLKKYLSGSSSKSKKKKINPKSRVIDDDIDLKDISTEPAKTDEESEDEAPIIASIIDERPFHVRAKEGYVTTQWKTLGPDDKEIVYESPCKKDTECENGRKRHDSDSDVSLDRGQKRKHDSSSGISPPRSLTLLTDKRKKGGSSSDISPPRNSEFNSNKNNNRELISSVKKDTGKSRNRAVLRHDSDSDISPPRKSSINNESTSNNRKSSFKREKRYANASNHRKSSFKRDKNYGNDDSDSDLSLPRPSTKQDSDNDLSPPCNKTRNIPRSEKRIRHDSDGDFSPPRNSIRSTNVSKNRSNRKRSLSPEVNKHSNDIRKKETLSGLKAGLQDARALRKELESAKKREEEMMKKIGDDISGKEAETIFREKNTGKRRNLKEEKRLQRIENEEKAKFDEKYMEWGKGVKQVEERHNRLGEDLYEMSKPLARYANDEDLEKLLKEQEREGDPMLKFIKKKKEREIDSDKVLPKYKGPPPPPNRFGIPPGYRWDGVDRSNDFEKKVFDRQSNKIAMEEEAYKWSVENM